MATVVRRCRCRTAAAREHCPCDRADIRWRARHGQGTAEVSRTFPSEREARTWLATVVADQARGVYVDHRDGRRTLTDWAAEWQAAQLHSANTAARVSWALEVHIKPTFGDRQLARISRLQVQQWVRQLSTSGYAPETVASLYSVLGSVLSAAVDEGLLASSPCRRVQLPRKDAPERPFVDEHQGLAIAEACGRVSAKVTSGTLPGPRARPAQRADARTYPAVRPADEPEHNAYGLLVITALFTGLRWGELVGLRRHNCQLLHKRLRIVESLHETAGSLTMGPPKTAASRRDVLLPPFLVDLLAQHLARSSDATPTPPRGLSADHPATCATSHSTTGDPPLGGYRSGCTADSSDFVFTGPRGALLRRSNFARRVWGPAAPDGLHFHDLRGSHKSLLLADGVPEFAIDMRLGHARRGVRDQYSHVLPQVQRRMLDGLQARWDGAQEKRQAG